MGDGTKAGSADGIDQEPLLIQGGDNLCGSQPVADHIEDDDIRVDILRTDFDCRNPLQLSRQPLGMVMIYF